MKKIGRYVARGVVSEGSSKRISIFDGSYKTGYKLVEFYISHRAQLDGESNTAVAKVATEDIEGGTEWNWSDVREVAWAYTAKDLNAPGGGAYFQSVIDPENLIIEDAYIILNDQFETDCNYMCVFEKYELEPMRGTLAMVQNRSQG